MKLFLRGYYYYALTCIIGTLICSFSRDFFTLKSTSTLISNIYLESFVVLIILDLKSFLIHYLKHKFSVLWRFHIVHHAQKDLFAISAAQAHLIDWVVSTRILNVIILKILGASEQSYLLYGCLLIVSTVFAHTPLLLPLSLRWLEFIFVTPRYHRLHHSNDNSQRRNYGDILVFWDHLFKTYQPPKEQKIDFGIKENERLMESSILQQQLSPFQKST